jgi:hypothetical protein
MPFRTKLWVTQTVHHFNFLLTFFIYYAMIEPTELTQNYERLNTRYDPNQPIETLFFRKFKTHELSRLQEASLTVLP